MNVGVNALLITKLGQIALQQRDDNPKITNPGFISMFGGTLEGSETIEECLQRELLEELELNLKSHSVEKLGVYNKTMTLDGQDYEIHVFIIRNIEPTELKLHEGKNIKYLSPSENLEELKLTRVTKAALIDFKKTLL